MKRRGGRKRNEKGGRKRMKKEETREKRGRNSGKWRATDDKFK